MKHDPMNDMIRTFKALSDETRLRIIKLLEHGELCVCDIVGALGMSQPKVSFHLGVLKNVGFLKDRKRGKWVHYHIDNTDLFRRFLAFSVLERIPEETVSHDKEKLEAFLRMKEDQTIIGPATGRQICCSRRQAV